MGKMSRDKGAQGEREVVRFFREYGLDAQRTAPLQAGLRRSKHEISKNADVLVEAADDLHIEVKRDQRMSVDAMWRQANSEAPPSKLPVLVYRRNAEKWKAVVPLSLLASLLAATRKDSD